jgi:hypothetical protein
MVVCGLVLGGVAGARTARAADEAPLMVIVEVGAGIGQDPGELRRAIGAELHRAVVGPTDPGAAGAGDLLLVVVNHDRIALALHERSDERVARSIPSPGDKAARLRAVVWLAGNVARDQVTPLLETLPAAHGAAEPEVATPATPVEALARPSTEPPPLTPRPMDATAAPEEQLASTPADAPTVTSRWTVMAAAGQGAVYRYQGDGIIRNFDTGVATQVEAMRHRGDGLLYGIAADFGPQASHRLGFAIAGGIERRWGRTMLEASLGVGFETVRGDLWTTTVVNNDSITGSSSSTTFVAPYAWEPYGRIFASVAHPISQSWDLVARVGVHAPVTGILETAYATASVGVRLRIP